MAPPVADALLASRDVRAPGPLYTIFAWADVGGLLVDRLVAGIDWQVRLAHGGHLTNVTAISDLARAFGLSRAHDSRKLAAAESIGGLGWTGRRGHSRIWISSGFYAEYAEAQARKLLIIDKAFPPRSPLTVWRGAEQTTSTGSAKPNLNGDEPQDQTLLRSDPFTA